MLALLIALPTLAQVEPAPALESRAQTLAQDGKLFAYAVSDGTLHIVTLPEGKPVVVATGFGTIVEGLDFSPDNKQLASVAGDGRIRIVASADGKLVCEFVPGPKVLPVWSRSTVDFVDDGTRILITGAQARSRILSVPGGEVVSDFLAAPDSQLSSESIAQAVAISDDKRHLALGDGAGWVSVRAAHNGDIEAGPFRVPAVHSMAFDPSARQLAVGSSDNGVWIFSLDRPPEPPRVLRHEDFPWPLSGLSVGSVCFNADGTRLLTTTFEFGEVRLWDTNRGSIVWSADTIDLRDSAAATTRFAGEPPVVVLAQSGMVFDVASGSRTRTRARGDGLEQFHMAGPYAWTSAAGRISIVDPHTGKLVCELPLATAR